MTNPMDDEISLAFTSELIDRTRPIIDQAIDQYAIYLATMSGDDRRAMRAMIFWFENLQAVQGTTTQTYIAFCAFMARRLQYHKPRLVRTMN